MLISYIPTFQQHGHVYHYDRSPRYIPGDCNERGKEKRGAKGRDLISRSVSKDTKTRIDITHPDDSNAALSTNNVERCLVHSY